MAPKTKILLIDDDFLVLRTLARVLEGRGYETKEKKRRKEKKVTVTAEGDRQPK